MKLNHKLKINLLFLALFIILSILMLWPLPIYMADRLFSPIDPLLNTWIIAWDVHQLQTDPFNLFNANIFFPLASTLAFSEHLFPLSLIAMPLILISGNPILGYNFIQLICFIISGFATYLLVFHLTKSRIAGFIAGIIFAFHPYRFRQLGHIQNIAVFWMPLTFLYLHKFLKKPAYKYMLLFTLFFVLQSLSCGYMGVFLSISVGLAIFYYLLIISRRNKLLLIKKLIVSVILIALFISPFLYPYLKVKKEHNFKRSVQDNIRISANIIGYTTISRFNKNVFYHQISRNLRKILYQTDKDKLRPIGRALFPGIIAIFLVLLGFSSLFPSKLLRGKKGSNKKKLEKRKLILFLDRLSNLLIFFTLLSIIIIIISRTINFSLGSFKFSMTHLTNPVYFLIFIFIVKLILSRHKLDNANKENRDLIIDRNFYLFLGFIAFILSLGPKIYFISHDFGEGPYMIFYKYFFFFEGIRVPERFGIIVMFALSILAGYGMVNILQFFKSRGKIILCFIISGLLIYEYICVPLQSTKIPREPKEIYIWLSKDKEEYGILEYPFDTHQKNKYYMYYSTFHWKKLANGSSGFNPSLFIKLRKLAHDKKNFPNQKFIKYLKSQVPVRYLILHLANFPEKDRREILLNTVKFSSDLKLVKIFNQNDYIYEIKYSTKERKKHFQNVNIDKSKNN